MAEQVARAAPGLQPERTTLSWSRTSLGVLGNGALLLVREVHGYPGPLRLALPVLAVLVAALVYVVAKRRERRLSRRPLPACVAPVIEVRIVGCAVLALIVAVAVLLPL